MRERMRLKWAMPPDWHAAAQRLTPRAFRNLLQIGFASARRLIVQADETEFADMTHGIHSHLMRRDGGLNRKKVKIC